MSCGSVMAADAKAMRKRFKELETRRDELVNELKDLSRRFDRKEITDDEYANRRHEIERHIVEVMDRLAQMRYLLSMGNAGFG